jgi:undecaprenyl-diphosphatase
MLKAIILGIIEGLTEFLPVSSTGHLILTNHLLSFEGAFANVFNVVIQMGAILSVVIYFFKDLMPKSTKKEDVHQFVSLWSRVVIGILPAGIIGILFEEVIDKYLFNTTVVAIALLVGAVWILLIDKPTGNKLTIDAINELSYKKVFAIGLFQCLALIPGMSRSAMTIIGGLIMGASRKIAAEFSFFMAIPVLGGAGLIKLIKYGVNFTNEQWGILAMGTFVSFVVAYLVIATFMSFIKKHTFRPFAYYRIVLGILVLLFA